MGRRLSRSERDAQRYAQEERAWTSFLRRLQAVHSLQEAVQLLTEAPGVDAPGRRYYSNLGFFLHSFRVPKGSNASERTEYARLIRVFHDEGLLVPGTIEAFDEDLKRASDR